MHWALNAATTSFNINKRPTQPPPLAEPLAKTFFSHGRKPLSACHVKTHVANTVFSTFCFFSRKQLKVQTQV